MRPFLKAVFLFILALTLTSFAVANRHGVRFVLDPFMNRDTAPAVELPLYVIVFATFLLGLLMGGLTVWFGQARWRKLARISKREADTWKLESEKLKRGLQPGAASASSVPSAARA
jgi:uncharacterized integral membrane protein